jgi:glutaminase
LLAQQLLIFRHQGLAILLSRCAHLDLEELQTTLGKDAESIFCGNLDQAIERAEDLYLASLEWGVEPAITLDAESNLGFLGLLEPDYRSRVATCLQRREFGAGEPVFRGGDAGDELFLVRAGRFTTTIQLEDGNRHMLESRLATFGPGMCFGEIAFLSGQARSATIRADVDGSCLVLSRRAFDALRRSDPEATNALLLALSRELGQKLSFTSQQLTQMEHL